MFSLIGIFLWFASLLTLALIIKIMWEHFFVYLYAHYIVNSSQAKLRNTLGYLPGAWALITGATEGIGRAYALELAGLGFNIIIHCRSEEKLAATLKQIKSDPQILQSRSLLGLSNSEGTEWIRTLKLDLSNEVDGATVENKLQTVLSGTDLRVLINNAGVFYDKLGLFMDDTDGYKICQKLVHVNVIGVLNFTRACLKHMPLAQKIDRENSLGTSLKERGGVVINLSSYSAVGTTPYISVYASTKAFIWHFARCLAAECRARGLIVQTVAPYLVVTKMTRLERVTLFRPTPETYVKSALKMIGVQEITFGYLPHAILGFLFGVANYLLPQTMALVTLKSTKIRYINSGKWD